MEFGVYTVYFVGNLISPSMQVRCMASVGLGLTEYRVSERKIFDDAGLTRGVQRSVIAPQLLSQPLAQLARGNG